MPIQAVNNICNDFISVVFKTFFENMPIDLWGRKNPETTHLRHFRVMKGYSYHPIKKAGNRNRTGDLRTTNATHYRLCYASIPFPLENFYTLSWRPCSVNHEFTFFVKSLDGHFFEHLGVDYSEKNFALIFSVGIFSPVQSSKAAAP